MSTEQDWQLKFRRILVVYQGNEPGSWLELLRSYANDVTLVSLDNYYARDYLQLPADCMVVDHEVEDLTGAGMLTAMAEQRALPTLIFHDARPGWCVPFLRNQGNLRVVAYDPHTFLLELGRFLDDTRSVDYEMLRERSPWLMEPWTATFEQKVYADMASSVLPRREH